MLSLAIAFAGTLSFLLLFFFYPFVYARFDKSLYDRYRTFGFTQPLHNHFSEYLRQYLSYFLPYVLGFLASFVVMFYLKLAVGISLLAFAIGCLVAFRLLKRGSILQKPWKVFGYLLASNFLSFQWALLVLFVATLWFDQHLSGVTESRAKTLLGICILMIVVLHAFLNALVSNLRIALALSVVAVVGAIVFAPGPAFLGGTRLRLLRLGGGLPISVMAQIRPFHADCWVLDSFHRQPANPDHSQAERIDQQGQGTRHRREGSRLFFNLAARRMDEFTHKRSAQFRFNSGRS